MDDDFLIKEFQRDVHDFLERIRVESFMERLRTEGPDYEPDYEDDDNIEE